MKPALESSSIQFFAGAESLGTVGGSNGGARAGASRQAVARPARLPIWTLAGLPDEPVPRALMLTSWPALSVRSAATVHFSLGWCANGSNEYQRMAFS